MSSPQYTPCCYPLSLRDAFPCSSGRIARAGRVECRHVSRLECGGHRLVDDDALDPDAGLPGLVKGAESNAFHGIVEIGIGIDDHRRVAAQLQHHLLLAGLGLQFPAHARRAGEAQELQPVVLGEEVGARSEEHTSELQSLMRISYAVFCLKQKTTKKSN